MQSTNLYEDELEANNRKIPYIYWYQSDARIILYIYIDYVNPSDITMDANHIRINANQYYMDFDIYDSLHDISYKYVENHVTIVGTKERERINWETLSKYDKYQNNIIYDGNLDNVICKYTLICSFVFIITFSCIILTIIVI